MGWNVRPEPLLADEEEGAQRRVPGAGVLGGDSATGKLDSPGDLA